MLNVERVWERLHCGICGVFNIFREKEDSLKYSYNIAVFYSSQRWWRLDSSSGLVPWQEFYNSGTDEGGPCARRTNTRRWNNVENMSQLVQYGMKVAQGFRHME